LTFMFVEASAPLWSNKAAPLTNSLRGGAFLGQVKMEACQVTALSDELTSLSAACLL
jgi:hypothetical protein